MINHIIPFYPDLINHHNFGVIKLKICFILASHRFPTSHWHPKWHLASSGHHEGSGLSSAPFASILALQQPQQHGEKQRKSSHVTRKVDGRICSLWINLYMWFVIITDHPLPIIVIIVNYHPVHHSRFCFRLHIPCSSNMQVQRDAKCAVSPMGQGSRRSPMLHASKSGIGFLRGLLHRVSQCLVNMQNTQSAIYQYTHKYWFLGTTTSVFICCSCTNVYHWSPIIACMHQLELWSLSKWACLRSRCVAVATWSWCTGVFFYYEFWIALSSQLRLWACSDYTS